MVSNNPKRVAAGLIGFIVLALVGIQTFRQPKSIDSGHRVVMGTFAHIIAVDRNEHRAKAAIEDAFTAINEVERLMSAYREDSEISQINRNAFSQPVTVSPDTFAVLEESIKYSRLSDGTFDITIGPMLSLWRKAADSNTTPTYEEIENARARVGYQNLLLDPNLLTVRFAVEGMKLDLGGIAKGYAIDKAIEALRLAGISGGMVDIGGDLACFGKPSAGKKHWLVGLQNPATTNPDTVGGDILFALKVDNAAVATSGDYRRFVLVNGHKQSHIIEPATGQGSREFSSVTIIADNAAKADALATAVSVLGKEKGLRLIENTDGIEAILISPDQEIIKTSGIDAWIK